MAKTIVDNLNPCFHGPFKVIEITGQIAYQLRLLDYSHFHPVYTIYLSPRRVAGLAPLPVFLSELRRVGIESAAAEHEDYCRWQIGSPCSTAGFTNSESSQESAAIMIISLLLPQRQG